MLRQDCFLLRTANCQLQTANLFLMLIDVIAFVLFLLAVFKGLRKGLIVAVFSFLALLVGLAAALKLSVLMAGYIGSNVTVSQRWLPFVAFVVVFVAVVLLVRLGAKLLEKAVQAAMLGWANRLGGVVFYVLIYFFVYSILLFYATQLNLLKPDAVQASVTYGWIEPWAPTLVEGLGKVIPFFRDLFSALLQFFEEAGKTQP